MPFIPSWRLNSAVLIDRATPRLLIHIAKSTRGSTHSRFYDSISLPCRFVLPASTMPVITDRAFKSARRIHETSQMDHEAGT